MLNSHPKIEKIHYLSLIDKNSREYEVYKQYSSSGGMISAYIKGGEKKLLHS